MVCRSLNFFGVCKGLPVRLCLLTYSLSFRKSQIVLNTQELEIDYKVADVIQKTNLTKANLIKVQTITVDLH